jgi:EAL domain-containing protein (putative c-di-GMP-specific phosphodiesterase class I)/CheY-like chemotaxis protein
MSSNVGKTPTPFDPSLTTKRAATQPLVGRVLLADDEPDLVRVYSRVLAAAGFSVSAASDGAEAKRLVGAMDFDAVVSDVNMPGLNGIDLLRAIRAIDLDLPVVLVTAAPTLDVAIRAVDLGALRFLVKPVEAEVLVDAVSRAVRMRGLARIKREALTVLGTRGGLAGDRAGLDITFTRALESLRVEFQPVVSLSRQAVFGYEALMRCDDSLYPNPGTLLEAAERLGRLSDLGGRMRDRVADAIPDLPEGALILLNLHSRDLEDETLYQPVGPLAHSASRIILEITERASLDGIPDVRSRLAQLRRLGYRVALDDMGAGYAGLGSFAQLEPEVVKFDMSLVRDVDRSHVKQRILRSMTDLCRGLGLLVIHEGVETAAERDTLSSLGADLLQGYLFSRPGRGFPAVNPATYR